MKLSGRAKWGLVAVAPLVGVLLLLASVATPPGRAVLKWAITSGAGEAIDADLHIGRIEGSPYSCLALVDVRLAREQTVAVETDRLEVCHHWTALLSGAVHIRRVEVDGLRLDLPALQAILLGGEASPATDEPGALPSITVDQIRIRAPRIRLTADEVLTELELAASATVSDERMAVRIDVARAHRGGVPIEVRGLATLRGETIEALDVSARAGDIEAELVREPRAPNPIAVTGRLRWPAGTIPAFLEAPILRASADLAVRIVGDTDAVDIALRGQLDNKPVRLRARGPNPPINVYMTTARLDPSRIHDSAPPARLDLALTATVSGLVPGPSGRAELRLQGRVQPSSTVPPIAIAPSRVAVAFDEDGFEPRMVLRTNAGNLTLDGRLSGGSSKIERLRLVAERLKLAALAPDQLSGVVTATITAKGPVDAPTLTSRLTARQLSVAPLQIGDISAQVSVDPRPKGLDVRWSEIRWAAPRAVWTSTAGSARLADNRLKVRDLVLTSDAGALRARADIRLDDPIGPRSSALVELSNLRLRAFAGLHPEFVTRPRGRVSGRLQLNGEEPSLNLDLDLRRARLTPRWPTTSARIKASVDERRAALNAKFNGPAWGYVRATADLPAPDAWRDPNAWTARKWDAIGKIATRFDVDLAGLDPGTFRSGSARGAATVADRGRQVSANITADGLKTEGLPRLTRLTLSAQSSARSIVAAVAATVEDRPALTAEVTLGGRLPDLLERPLAAVPAKGQANVEDFPIALLQLRPFGPKPITGRITVRASGRNGPRGPRLDADVTAKAVLLTPDVPPIEAKVRTRIDERTLTASVTAVAAELGDHRLELRAPTARLGQSNLIQHLERVSYEGRDVSLAAATSLAGAVPISGSARLRVDAGPGLSGLTAQLSLRNAAVARALSKADVDVRLTGSSTQSSALATVDLNGARLVTARLSTPLTVRRAIRGRLDSASIPIRAALTSPGFPVQRALRDPAIPLAGQLDLLATVEGTIGMPKVDASLRIPGLTVGKTTFDRFEASHLQQSGRRETNLTLTQTTGGRLTVAVDAAQSAEIAATKFRFDFLGDVADVMQAGVGIEGTLDGRTTIRAADGPTRFDGQLIASGLRVALPGAPAIQRGTLSVGLADRRVDLELSAKSGPGSMSAEATFDTSGATPTLDGRFALDDVQAGGGGQVISIDLTGQISGQGTDDGFAAEVSLKNGLIRLPDKSARALHPINQRSDVVYQRTRWQRLRDKPAEPAPSSAYSVRIRSAKPIGVRGEPVDAVVSLDVLARPSTRGVSVKGDARVEQGTVNLFGRRYTVERAQVQLGGHVPAKPRVDVLLSYEFDACTFFISTSGPVANPKLKLWAEPDIYDDKQLLGFLFGASPDEDNPDKTPEQQGIDAAAGLLLGQLQSQLKKNLPIDTLAVDLGDGTSSGQANVSLGKWITDRLFVAYTYRHGASQTENTSEGLLRYRFLRSWLVELVFGDRGNGAADLLWTKRW